MKDQPSVERIEKELAKIGTTSKQLRDSTFTRFPIIFSLLTTFGLVATLYGFEKVIDKIAVLSDNPEILLVIGLVVLAATGTLYKKLS